MSIQPPTMPESARDSLSGSVARCVIAVAAYFSAVFASLETIGERVSADFRGPRTLSAAMLSELVHPFAAATLAELPVVGAGFVPAPGILSDHEFYLAWWQGEERTLLAQRGVPIGHHVFDYSRHEWFQVPLTTGQRHITGPYVDYVCTDEYVLTATVPVLAGGRMIGVAGADTTLETFETLMHEPLHSGGDLVIVNELDRCVVASDPLLRSGQRVDATAYDVAQRVEGFPFRVLGS
ncbi:MAG TPA: cache domain-containing protein [Nocardioides sp.]|nr:cache domain-containing protein [Nocardioides sp.]